MKEDKATWFCKEGATATLMVPWTPNSELALRLRDILTTSKGPRGTSVKIVERPGMTVMSSVRDMRMFRRVSCNRMKCPLLSTDTGCLDRCYKEGVIYMGSCKICHGDKKSIYIG